MQSLPGYDKGDIDHHLRHLSGDQVRNYCPAHIDNEIKHASRRLATQTVALRESVEYLEGARQALWKRVCMIQDLLSTSDDKKKPYHERPHNRLHLMKTEAEKAKKDRANIWKRIHTLQDLLSTANDKEKGFGERSHNRLRLMDERANKSKNDRDNVWGRVCVVQDVLSSDADKKVDYKDRAHTRLDKMSSEAEEARADLAGSIEESIMQRVEQLVQERVATALQNYENDMLQQIMLDLNQLGSRITEIENRLD